MSGSIDVRLTWVDRSGARRYAEHVVAADSAESAALIAYSKECGRQGVGRLDYPDAVIGEDTLELVPASVSKACQPLPSASSRRAPPEPAIVVTLPEGLWAVDVFTDALALAKSADRLVALHADKSAPWASELWGLLDYRAAVRRVERVASAYRKLAELLAAGPDDHAVSYDGFTAYRKVLCRG